MMAAAPPPLLSYRLPLNLGVRRRPIRIAVYESGALTDNDVPAGWVRVPLRA